MNASEKEITGVEDMNGLGSIRDALMAQAVSLAAIDERQKAQEVLRTEARGEDREWRTHQQDKFDKLFDVTDAMRATIAEIPAAIDRQVAVALKAHVDQTDGSRRTFASVLVIFGILIALAVASTLEFVDHENTAGRILAALAVVVTLGGWYISSRKK